MNATSDPSAPAAAWPAAHPAGIDPIQHPAWEAARNAVLDRAAEGPVTAIVVGDPGTGKSWLLRELASALGEHGFPTMLLMQGNLPASLSPGAALLVDDASLMSESTRADLLAQQHGVVVLAGAEWFEDDVDPAAADPVLIRLRNLDSAEIATFAAEWLQRSGLTDSMIGPGLLARLAAGSEGRVGPLVQLLIESAKVWQETPIVALKEPPALKLPLAPQPPPAPPIPVPAEAPAATTPVAPTRRRRSLSRPLVVSAAIAAVVVLAWATVPRLTRPPAAPPATLAETAPLPTPDTPEPAKTADAAPALPPLGHADIPAPTLAAAALPAQPAPARPPLAPTPPSDLATAEAAPTLAAIPSSPPVIAPPDPTLVATLDDPADAQKNPTRPTPPGLVLVAQRGDTLESLYGDVYRDRNAPPLAKVRAANPGPVRPGAIVVFPEPPGGWQRVQR